MHNGMASFKFKIKASQARSIYHNKKLKIKVLKHNAHIFFNKQCLAKKLFQIIVQHKQWDPIGRVKECILTDNIIL